MAKKRKMFREIYDSPEEWHFALWLNQLVTAGYVKNYTIHPTPYQLFEEVKKSYFTPFKNKEGGKHTDEAILRSHSYGADFIIYWDENAKDIFFTMQDSDIQKKFGHSMKYILAYEDGFNQSVSVVEVKPAFDRHNMTKVARMHQQMVYYKYEVYVNILTPFKHFDKTFTPDRYFYTDKEESTNTRSLKYKSVKTLHEFLHNT